MSAARVEARAPSHGFRHEALLYAGAEDFVRQAAPFVRDGVDRDEAVLVVIAAERIELLRSALGAAADRVFFADMGTVGRNPACIIPVWNDFVSRHAVGGRSARGIGEPIWAGRSAHELEECHLHESLLNRAFEDASGMWLVCPYDTNALAPEVVATALHTHPYVCDGETQRRSNHFDPAADLFREPLEDPPDDVERLEFGRFELARLRGVVAEHAAAFGLSHDRAEGLVLTVHELATNSVRHGGGRGTLRVWIEGETLLCDVRDRGVIDEPLVGRRQPDLAGEGGRGLWLVNQLSELVQIRSSADGTVVRVHVSRAA